MINHSLPYITGMGYRYLCDYKYDEFETFNIEHINQFDGMKIFVKTDYLIEFHNNVLNRINKKFYLYTHNSDLCIDNNYINILNNDYLIEWLGQNINIKHNKLKSIPIGLANKRWQHGNIEIFDKVVNLNNVKDNLVYCNFDVNTNFNERSYCLQNIEPIINSNKVDFETYLTNLSKSYFCISPNGNGIDCHKHWESLYLNTIPIVTNSINIENYKNLPFLTINDWQDFKNLNLSVDLYYNIWNNYNKKELFINEY